MEQNSILMLVTIVMSITIVALSLGYYIGASVSASRRIVCRMKIDNLHNKLEEMAVERDKLGEMYTCTKEVLENIEHDFSECDIILLAKAGIKS